MDVTSKSLSDALLESLNCFSKNIKENIKKTLIVETKIIGTVDEEKGIYKVQYLDSKFDAAAAYAGFCYEKNQNVYVIIPEGDFSKNKVILSPVNPTPATTIPGTGSYISNETLYLG